MTARLVLAFGLLLAAALVVGSGGMPALGNVLVGAGPLLLLGALLLAGRYPGERVLLALARRRGVSLRAALARSWACRGRRTVGAALLRSSRTLRGPPRLVPAA